MIYQGKERISFYDLDANGDIKLTALLKYIGEAAFYNAEDLGIGLEKTLKTNLAFIIQRVGVRIFKIPEIKQEIVVRTWPGEITRSAFKRYGEICSEDGDKLIEWESLWVLIDIDERKIKRPSSFSTQLPCHGKLNVDVVADKIIPPEEKERHAGYSHTVQFSELDVNWHMNNAIYSDLIANVLSLNTSSPKINTWKEVKFNYIHEAKFGDEIVVNAYQSDDRLYITGSLEEKAIFTAEINYEG